MPNPIAGIISCVAIVWHFILNIIAVSENYGFTWGKSALVLLTPIAVAAFISISIMGIGTIIGVSALMNMGI